MLLRSLTCVVLLACSPPAFAATITFNDPTVAVGGGGAVNTTHYTNAAGATLNSVRSQDIVHEINFYADSTIPWEEGLWYTLFETGGAGTGTSVHWKPTAIGPNPSLGPGNHINSAEIAYLAGGGNSDAVVVPLNYSYSSANISIVAGFDRDGNGGGGAPTGAGEHGLYLFIDTDRTQFTSSTQHVASGVNTNAASNSWAGGDSGGVGTNSGNTDVQGEGNFFGTNGAGFATNAAGNGDNGHVPAAAFPGLSYQAHYNLNGAGTAPQALNFANVTDTSDPTFAFGLLGARTIPEPSRALLLALGCLAVFLRRRR